MKNVRVRNTSPSLGRLFKQRAVMLHESAVIIPAYTVTGAAGVVRTIPARVAIGHTYFKKGSKAWLRAGGEKLKLSVNN